MEHELAHYARYPFLPGARDYVASLGMSFDKMLAHPVYSAVLERGLQRLLSCVDGKYSPELSDQLSTKLSILSYPIARMMAHSIGQPHLSKYAEGEAESAYYALMNEPEDIIEKMSSQLGLKITDSRMSFLDYLRFSSQISRRNPRWRLANHVVDAGHVEVTEDEAKILLREAIKNRVMEPLNLSHMPASVKKAADDIKTSLVGERQIMEIKQLEDKAMPPCVTAIISALEIGVASHNSMFILATFLANLGLSTEDILSIFSRSPKYDAEKTAYQLRFITGERGATQYTCPTCVTIRSQGLCKAECGVRHPLQHYRRNAKNKPQLIKRKKK